MRKLIMALGQGLRDQVLPQLGSHAGRDHVHSGAGGDVTFAIDHEAESFLERFLAEHAPSVAFYSEDRGLVEPADARVEHVLVVDPIDGTRPAMAGLESCCVSVAAAPLSDGHPTMADVRLGLVVEIKTGTAFVAERGSGVEIANLDGSRTKPRLSPNTDVSRMFWTMGFRGRPAGPLVRVLEELIDRSSVGGAVFDLGSATYDMTRIVTGQLDAYLDVGSHMIDRCPAVLGEFERLGRGAVLNNSPYDLAAAALILSEAGAVVTDATGRPLDERPLLGCGPQFQMSCLAAANHELHSRLLEGVEVGMRKLERIYGRAD